MAGAKYTDRSRDVRQRLDSDVADRVARTTVFFWTEVQKTLNLRVNPPPYQNSAPKGEPPAKRTGYGAGNVVYEIDRDVPRGRVGLTRNAIYMHFLEFRGHSWLKWTLDRVRGRLQALMSGGRS